MTADAEHGWFPVVASAEVVAPHLFHARLQGRELVIWRDDGGRVNVWDNRCPHRSVRLSLGIHCGNRLKCRYHGWEFATGTGRCQFVPAHPTTSPPDTGPAVLGAAEHGGFVWASLAPPSDAPWSDDSNALGKPSDIAADFLILRSMVVRASAERTAAGLLSKGVFDRVAPMAGSAYHFNAEHRVGEGEPDRLVLMVQPSDVDRAVVHGRLSGHHASMQRVARLRGYNGRLASLRDALEHPRGDLLEHSPQDGLDPGLSRPR